MEEINTEQQDPEANSRPTTFNQGYYLMFLFYYLVEGSNNGLLTIFVPVFLIKSDLPGVDAPFILTLATFATIPFAIKIFYGLISDKFPIGNLGRRRPYISGGIIVCGVFWLLMIAVLPYVDILSLAILIVFGVTINIGAAFSDTALDGLIIDITPKDMLGRVEGNTWAFYSVGTITGGTLGILLWLLTGNGISVFILFGMLSIMSFQSPVA
ncbi:MAG: MFS transporter [Candidatus Hodarchaeota archaeon]